VKTGFEVNPVNFFFKKADFQQGLFVWVELSNVRHNTHTNHNSQREFIHFLNLPILNWTHPTASALKCSPDLQRCV
jgi:hypothetical protein